MCITLIRHLNSFFLENNRWSWKLIPSHFLLLWSFWQGHEAKRKASVSASITNRNWKAWKRFLETVQAHYLPLSNKTELSSCTFSSEFLFIFSFINCRSIILQWCYVFTTIRALNTANRLNEVWCVCFNTFSIFAEKSRIRIKVFSFLLPTDT